MAIPEDLKERAQLSRGEGVFTLKLDEGVSLALLVEFAQDMFPGISTKDSVFGPRTMVSWWSRCAVAEQLLRIEGCRDALGRRLRF